MLLGWCGSLPRAAPEILSLADHDGDKEGEREGLVGRERERGRARERKRAQ